MWCTNPMQDKHLLSPFIMTIISTWLALLCYTAKTACLNCDKYCSYNVSLSIVISRQTVCILLLRRSIYDVEKTSQDWNLSAFYPNCISSHESVQKIRYSYNAQRYVLYLLLQLHDIIININGSMPWLLMFLPLLVLCHQLIWTVLAK